MGFDLGLDLGFDTCSDTNQMDQINDYDPKEYYLSQYCKFDEQLGKYLYCGTSE